MSSTYTVLCLSHDPAIVASEEDFFSAEEAMAAMRSDIRLRHPYCDLVIGRFSYPLISVLGLISPEEWTPAVFLKLLLIADKRRGVPEYEAFMQVLGELDQRGVTAKVRRLSSYFGG